MNEQSHPAEHEHQIHKIGWLRASVLGANDGLLSTASLIVGVAAGKAPYTGVVLAGVAGLVAGAMAMAAAQWPALRLALAAAFKGKSRAQWCQIMAGSDVCFAPVLRIDEAAEHEHMRARGVFQTVEGVVQPAPAPRLSRTPGAIQPKAQNVALDISAVLQDWCAEET